MFGALVGQTQCFYTLADSFALLRLFCGRAAFIFSDLRTLLQNTRGGAISALSLRCLCGKRSVFRLGVDRMLDVRLQEAQRDRALLKDSVVEGSHAKLGGEAALGFGAQFA